MSLTPFASLHSNLHFHIKICEISGLGSQQSRFEKRLHMVPAVTVHSILARVQIDLHTLSQLSRTAHQRFHWNK